MHRGERGVGVHFFIRLLLKCNKPQKSDTPCTIFTTKRFFTYLPVKVVLFSTLWSFNQGKINSLKVETYFLQIVLRKELPIKKQLVWSSFQFYFEPNDFSGQLKDPPFTVGREPERVWSRSQKHFRNLLRVRHQTSLDHRLNDLSAKTRSRRFPKRLIFFCCNLKYEMLQFDNSFTFKLLIVFFAIQTSKYLVYRGRGVVK